jgi:L-serine dehydratase
MKFRFHSYKKKKKILESETISPEEYAIKREAFIKGQGEDVILGEIDRRIAITRASIIKGLKEPQHSRSGLTRGAAVAFFNSERTIIKDELYRRTVAYSLAINEVNACGGKIVAFPTAGSSGIVAGAIWAWWDTHNTTARTNEQGAMSNEERASLELPPANDPSFSRLRGAFLISGLVGVIIAQRATIAGSEGGCQAECGSAGAMAACALSYLENLSLDECFSAAALSLKNSLGLACDPVAGLVEVPCVKRNAFVAVNALIAVDMTLAGIRSAIPFDDVVFAMKQISEAMPANIRENAQGGLAATPSGLAVRDAMTNNKESSC